MTDSVDDPKAITSQPPSDIVSVAQSSAPPASSAYAKEITARLRNTKPETPAWAVALMKRPRQTKRESLFKPYYEDRTLDSATAGDILGVGHVFTQGNSAQGKTWESPWQAVHEGKVSAGTLATLKEVRDCLQGMQRGELDYLRGKSKETEPEWQPILQAATASVADRSSAIRAAWSSASWAARRYLSLASAEGVVQSLYDSTAATKV